VPFTCSICEQESTRICGFCTKDACGMHICERCGCCSDCCQCDVPLDEPLHAHTALPPEPIASIPPEPVVETSQPESPGLEPQPLAAPWAPAEAQSTTPEESGFEPFDTPEG
jgi:hypothetical protein